MNLLTCKGIKDFENPSSCGIYKQPESPRENMGVFMPIPIEIIKIILQHPDARTLARTNKLFTYKFCNFINEQALLFSPLSKLGLNSKQMIDLLCLKRTSKSPLENRLRRLDLTQSRGVDDCSLIRLALCCSNLEELILPASARYTDNGVKGFGKCPKLRSLILEQIPQNNCRLNGSFLLSEKTDFPALDHLDLSWAHSLTCVAMERIFSMKQLRVIKIQVGNDFSIPENKGGASHLTELHVFNIKGTVNGLKKRIQINQETLRNITLEAYQLHDPEVIAVIGLCKKIQRVVLSPKPRMTISDEMIEPLLRNKSEIKHLDFNQCYITFGREKQFLALFQSRIFVSQKSIKVLGLPDFNHVEEKIALVAACPNLELLLKVDLPQDVKLLDYIKKDQQQLRVQQCNASIFQGLRVAKRRGEPYLSRKMIRAHGCHITSLTVSKEITSQRLMKTVSEACQNIKTLNLKDSAFPKNILEGILEDFLKANPYVEQLFLDRTHCSDALLLRIRQMCPHLLEISIAGCKEVSSEGIEGLLEFPTRLTKINFSGIAFDFFHEKSVEHLKKLNSADLQNTLISDKSLQWIANHCSDLDRIDLQGCNISNAGIKILSKGCVGLKEIYLTSSSRLDKASLALAGAIEG